MRLSTLIRRAADRGLYGQRRTPATFSMGADYCSYYWSSSQDLFPTHAEWIAASELLARYHRFHHYVTETLPGWQNGRRFHYADNSIEVEQVARDGRTRRVMEVAPHGDLCF